MHAKTRGRLCRAIALALCACATATAQDKPPETKPPDKVEDDLDKLLKDADAKIEEGETKKKDKPSAKDDTPEALRAAADDAANEDRGLLGSAMQVISERGNELNPRLTVIGDFLGRGAVGRQKTVEGGASPDDRFSVREIELDLRAAIDPYANGVLVLAFGEEEPGKYEADVEEGFITLERLPYHLKLKLGRFRIPFGQVNRSHQHDLPQSLYPYALRDLFGAEGYSDNGAHLSWVTPLPIPVELSALVLQGENERILSSPQSTQPAYMGRAEVFFDISGDSSMWASLGASYLFGFNDTRGTIEKPRHPRQESHLMEVDFLVKWQPSQFKSVVFLTELYHAIKRERSQTLDLPDGGVDANGNPTTAAVTHMQTDRGYGVYTMLQVQPLQQWYFGIRGDWSDFDEAREGRTQWAASAWVAFYTSEFLRFRVGYEHRERLGRSGDPTRDASPNDTLFFQVTFVFGSHPPEPFWVNK